MGVWQNPAQSTSQEETKTETEDAMNSDVVSATIVNSTLD